MKQVVTAQADSWGSQETQHYKFTIYQSGARRFLEVTISPNMYSEGESFTVEMCRNERKVQVEDAFLQQNNDLFRQMADMVKNAQGMWQPKFQEGDVVMIDKAGSPTVKIIDPLLQTSETLEKKQVIIDKEDCSCSLRTLMQLGCARKRGSDRCEA